MTHRSPADRGGDAQRVVDALADLFDELPPRDRAAAEEELRADGANSRQAGERMAQLAATALPAPARRRAALHSSAAHFDARGSARPIRRRSRVATRIVSLTGALAAAAVAAWLLWQPRPEPIVRRVPVPGNLRSLPDRPLGAGLERPRHDEEPASAAARAAPATPVTVQRSDSNGAVDDGGTDVREGSDVQPQEQAIDDGSDEDVDVSQDASTSEGAAPNTWILDRTSWRKARDRLPEPVLRRVKSGDYRFVVRPLDAESLTNRYLSDLLPVSQLNAGHYDIRPGGCALRDVESGLTPATFFGFPFPAVDPNSPAAGCEIMWNVEAWRGVVGGQETAMTLDWFSPESRAATRRELRLDSAPFFGHQSMVGDRDALRWAQIARWTAPAEVAGTAVLTKRPNDPDKRDQIWAFVPALRRVRSVSPANRSDGMLGSTLAWDELGCFDGKLEDFNWRLVGSQTVLAPMTHGSAGKSETISSGRSEVAPANSKAMFEQPDSDATGAPWLVVNELIMVPRQVWLVEGVPRDKYYLYGRLLLYIDAAMYRPYWLLSHSWNGELQRSTMCTQQWARTADPSRPVVFAAATTAVEEHEARATLGRYTALTIDRGPPDESRYSLESITKMVERNR